MASDSLERKLPYTVELWSDDEKSMKELLAMSCEYGLAYSAFKEALSRAPKAKLAFRYKGELIDETEQFRKRNKVVKVPIAIDD